MMYGLPKIHKQGVPLRPIVSCIDSPAYKLSKHVSMLISPLAGHNDSFVKNTKHFVDEIKTIKLDHDEIQVSLDVKSLFTNVPIREVIDVIREKLRKDNTLVERTALSA